MEGSFPPFRFVSVALLLSIWCISHCSGGGGDESVGPLVLDCVDNDVHLFVRPYRLSIGNETTFNTRLYFHDNIPQFPAPTLRMKAGSQCRLTITNQLNPRTGVGDCNFHMNDVHCPDTTNVHTHGLHVSPDEDDISVAILPGETHTYTYNLPISHLMGTHWYHPHYHGSVNLQLNGGMHGAIIVEPHDSYSLPQDLERLYANAHVLVLSHVSLDDTPDIEEAIFSYRDVVSDFGEAQTIPLSPTFHSGLKTFYAVNGDHRPSFDAIAGSAVLLRFVQSSGFSMASIAFASDEPECTLQLVARDGVFQRLPYLNVSAVHIPQAGRADVAVHCATPGVRHLSLKSDLGESINQLMGRPDGVEQDVLFSLNVLPHTRSAASTPLASSEAPLPDYLSGLRGSEVQLSPIENGYMYEENTIVMAAVDNHDSINAVQFPGFHSQRYIGTLCLGQTYEIQLNASPYVKVAAHPYHQHVYSFQVATIVDPSGELIRHGEWRDVIPAVYHENGLRVRFRPMDYSGTVMLHCHILQHEDEGMMAMFNVVDEDGECGSAASDGSSTLSRTLVDEIFPAAITTMV